MFSSKNKTSLTWTLFLLVLMTTQLREGDAVTSIKLKKLLKKILLLRALSPKKSLAIVPIPIPLSLIKETLEKLTMPKMMEMPKMEMPKMPPPMYPYPSYMHGGLMMMGKSDDIMMPKEMTMPTKEEMMASGSF